MLMMPVPMTPVAPTVFKSIAYSLLTEKGNAMNFKASEETYSSNGKRQLKIWLPVKNVLQYLKSVGITASYNDSILYASVPNGTALAGTSINTVPTGRAVLVLNGAVHQSFYVLVKNKTIYIPSYILGQILHTNGIVYNDAQTKFVTAQNNAATVRHLTIYAQNPIVTTMLPVRAQPVTVYVSALDHNGVPVTSIKVQATINGTPTFATTNRHGIAAFKVNFGDAAYLPITFATGSIAKTQILQSPSAPASLTSVIALVNASAKDNGQIDTQAVTNLLLYEQNQQAINGFQGQVLQSQNATQNSVAQSQNAVQDSVNGATSTVTGAISTGTSTLQNSVTQAQTAVQNSISQGVQSVNDNTDSVGNMVQNSVMSAQNAVQKSITQGVQSVNDNTDNVGNMVQNSVTQSQNAVQNSLNTGLATVSQFVQDGFNNVQTQVSSVASSAQTAAQAAQTAATLAKGTTVNIYQNAPILTVTATQSGTTYTLSGQLEQSSSPVVGQTIQFSDAGAGGTFSVNSATTDTNGQFSVTYTPPASFITSGGQITLVAFGDGVTGSTTI